MKTVWATIILLDEDDVEEGATVDLAVWDSEEAAAAALIGYGDSRSGETMEVRKMQLLTIDDVRNYLNGDMSGEDDS